MYLRSGRVKKVLFTPGVSSSPFFTPLGVTPVKSVRDQKIEQEELNNRKKMAESVEALNQCCMTAKGKVERIRNAILAADNDHNKFSIHGLKLYLKTTDSAYDEYNSFQNRIYLTDPTLKVQFEPLFIDFEELYEFVRISLCEMIQKHDDDQKAIAETVKMERERKISTATGPGTSANASQLARMQPSLVLQQTPLPTFDGQYEHWFKFKARFCDIVDKCIHDSPATKLHYLDKALIGDAKGVIDEQTLNDNNYQGAWRLLVDRFENLPMVIHNHVTKLLNLKSMAKESSLELKRLIDDCVKRVESLEFHKLKMDKMAEAIVITLLTSKLDSATRRSWEQSVEYGKLPAYNETISFLRKHCHVLERCEQIAPMKARAVNTYPKNLPAAASKIHTVTVPKGDDSCAVCNGRHFVDTCETFKKLTTEARYDKAKQLGLCFACLKRGHRTMGCKSSKGCTSCSKKHHPLLHYDEKSVPSTDASPIPVKVEETSSNKALTAAECSISFEHSSMAKQVLLATAVVNVYDCRGEAHLCRILLDSGAMASFVTERMADLLGLPKEIIDVPVVGVNGMKTTVKFKVNVKVTSRTTDCDFSLDYLVVPRVTGALPTLKVDPSSWPIPEGIVLADPKFYDPSRVDMLVGAEIFLELIQAGKIKMSNSLPVLQESLLGWLVSGPVGDSCIGTVKVCQATSRETSIKQLNEMLKQFWKIDEQEGDSSLSCDEQCELHFMETYGRLPDGRYIVMMPFRENVGDLGESRKQAEKRFASLERRLDRMPELKKMYVDFIQEYLALGHCRVVPEDEVKGTECAYYLPHHCVLKPDSSTTKLRVVFDASAKSTTELSLNDVMFKGPTVQESLFNILLRFRLPKYAFTADVSKMFRQVMLYEIHRKYLRFLWRESRTDPLQELELKTVTYETAAAPYLATRVIVQLARDEQRDFPDASEVALKSFYIDDVLSGADSLEQAKQLRDDLIALLSKGGFKLHKWCANDGELLDGIPEEARERQLNFEESDVNGVIKTLGILWNPADDQFMFLVNPVDEGLKRPTKRMVLSETAKLFDPLGLLAPIIVIAKRVMQHLWHENVDWDEPVPDDQFEIWTRFRSELCSISNAKIERRVTMDYSTATELHGFADASKTAYGCCIYLRNVRSDGTAELRLVCGMSRVAPIKELQREETAETRDAEMTIPRLELCAALLLAEQMKKVREALAFNTNNVVLWSDSKIVLCWLKKMKSETSVFVRNRVTKIRELFPSDMWQYVPTKSNPADLVSRGVFPKDLIKNTLWWTGPEFLQTVVYQCSEDDDDVVVGDQAIEQTVTLAIPVNELYDEILACSNFRKLQRIFAYINRFIYNCRAKKRQVDRRCGRLTNVDHNEALMTMVIIVQQVVYCEEIDYILKGKLVKGKLRNLNPIYDRGEKLLRVGGRLRHSDLPKDQKHPMILPEKHHFTSILVEALHREHLHVGLNGLLAAVRQKFWPVNAKRTIHRVIRQCVTCFKVKPSDVQQFMGDLPSCRVTAAQPFVRTGVDYAGPFLIKVGRGKARIKAYVCLFVCMVTKAIHLELVTSLTTEGFLAALQRFVGRRGNPSNLFSDNGTNFRGAEKELTELIQLLKSQILENRVNEFCQPRGISWSFNPPKAPHQGGIWEANVKCMKSHLYKTLNESYLSHEEMDTLLIQVEAILNSRPLVQMSDDPVDYEALSPGHFLVGRELTAIAEPLYEDLRDSSLSRYQLLQKRKQCFWRRWSNEYITSLQKRSKWFKVPTLLKNGLLVILKEDNMPSQTWKLGRIVELHPGRDGITRVVTVRTKTGTYRRPTTQIAVLPIYDEEEEPSIEEC